MLNAIWIANTPSKMLMAVVAPAANGSIDATALERAAEHLEMSLPPLAASYDRIENWLTGFTLLVVLGLMVEAWDAVPEFVLALKSKRSGLHFESSASPAWKAARAFIGVALITVGVSGEVVETLNAGAVEGKMRDANKSLNEVLEAKTALATEAAAKLGVKFADLSGTVDRKTGEVEKSINELTKVQRDAKAAVASIRHQILDRALCKEQSERLQLLVSGNSPGAQKVSAINMAVAPGPEPEQFADQIRSALSAGGVTVHKIELRRGWNGPEIMVLIPTDDLGVARNHPLSLAMRSAELSVGTAEVIKTFQWPGMPTDLPVIIVGERSRRWTPVTCASEYHAKP